MNSKFFTAKNIATLGILVALVVVLQLFASSIPMFGVTLNFSLIPIALASILLGWVGGGIVGFVCGVVVFITTAVLGQEKSTALLFQTEPVILTIMCISKTTLAGIFSGLVFKWLKRYNLTMSTVVSSLIIPVVNTGVYLLGIVLMSGSVAEFLSLTSFSANVVFIAVFTIIWLNLVLEIAITSIFTPVLHRVIKVLKIGL